MSGISHLSMAPPVLVVVLAVACSGSPTAPDMPDFYSLAQLQADFDQYVEAIYEDHPRPFTDEAVLEQTVARQRKVLRDGMTEMEFYRVMAPVGAAVRCGHTRTFLSEKGRERLKEKGPCLPMEIRLLDDELFVYKDFTAAEEIPRGSRVISINDNAAATIIWRMRESRFADGTNVTYKDYGINRRFAELFTILFGGYDQFEVEIEAPGSAGTETRVVDALSPVRADEIDRERYGPWTGCERLCMEISDDRSYAVLTVKDFGYYEDPDEFRKPVGEFFARLGREGVGALILDLRGNDGGDPYCSSFVASHVVDEPVRYFARGTPFYDDLVRPIPVPEHVFTGMLVVLTDGWCFSSTGHLLSLLRCHDRGLMVGEEAGGSFACNDASKMHVMDHTGLRLNLPRRTFATSATCLPLGRGIPPDVEVRPTIDDLIVSRDAVLERAISLVSGG